MHGAKFALCDAGLKTKISEHPPFGQVIVKLAQIICQIRTCPVSCSSTQTQKTLTNCVVYLISTVFYPVSHSKKARILMSCHENNQLPTSCQPLTTPHCTFKFSFIPHPATKPRLDPHYLDSTPQSIIPLSER